MSLNTPQQNDKVMGPAIVGNNLGSTNEFKIKIVTTAQGAKTNLLIIPGPTPIQLGTRLGCTVPEQTECVITSSVNSNGNAAGYLELKEYLAQVGFIISYIRMTASDTGVWGGTLVIGEMPPNGYPAPRELPFSKYAQGLGGGGLDKTLYIRDESISTTKNFFMYVSSMPASCTLEVVFGISNVGNTFTVNGQ